MSEQSRTTSKSSTMLTTRRFWRRTDQPASWWPWGILPIAGLAILFLFGAAIIAPDIQAEVRTSVGNQLSRAGVAVGSITADGQRVSARVAGTNYDNTTLAALGEATRCSTWAGELRCPSQVAIEQDMAEASPALAELRPHQFQFVRNGESLVLRGEVPSSDERDRIVGIATAAFGQVDDRLAVSDVRAGQGYSEAADQALEVVKNLVSGQASWSGERLSVSGLAEPHSVAVAKAQFEGTEASGMLGDFDVQALHTETSGGQSCNDRFAGLLDLSSIQFQTNSAEIDAASESLLAELADVARTCSGRMTIAGHTDSRGDAAMNEALSVARAAAVRDAFARLGIETERMTAVGFGETQPVADNSSAEGRARNRRIAISMDPTE